MDQPTPGPDVDYDGPTMEHSSVDETSAHTVESAVSAGPATAASMAYGKKISQQIGNYTIERVLGEGGMGLVYLAQQESPRRQVALKVIRASVASPAILTRFALEVQVLGNLDHPGIAQIFEAGSADTGDGPQPYFVMEYIRGVTLTEFANRHELSTRNRLELIARICDAVQHAHQKGVIHRDLKPGNILVADGATPAEAQPKILDFGVARATDSDIQSATLQGATGNLIGTIPYMSPEQAGGDPGDVDTRSDVYALGVIAYELLGGGLPHDFRKKTIHEAVRVIREDEPKPLGAIHRALSGDIEIIVGKALEKDRDRRYQTASALADDIRRFLAHEPIVARPPSVTYQLHRFARRNKAIVGGVLGMLVVSAIGTIVSVTFAVDSSNSAAAAILAQGEAEAREKEAITAKEAEEAARQEEARQRTIAESVGRFMNEDFVGLIDPESGMGQSTTVLELVQQASASIEDRFEDEPEVEAQIRLTIGRAFGRLGLLDDAQRQLDRSLVLRTGLFGRQSVESVEVLAATAAALENDDIDTAITLAQEVLATSRSLLDADDPRISVSQGDLAMYQGIRNMRDTGEFLPGASPMLLRMFASVRGRGETPEEVAQDIWVTITRIDAAWQDDDKDRANELLEEMLGPFLKAPTLAGRVPYALAGMGISLIRLDQALGAAECVLAWAIDRGTSHLGDQHPHTLAAVLNMAALLRGADRLDEAESHALRARDGFVATLGKEHANSHVAMRELAAVYEQLGRLDESKVVRLERLEVQQAALGDDDPEALISLYNFTVFLRRIGNYTAAEEYAIKCYEGNVAQFGEEHEETRDAIELLARVYDAWHIAEPDGGYDVKGKAWKARLGD